MSSSPNTPTTARCTAQAQILARQGITIDRSVLAFWTGYAAAEIKPVWRLMREELLRSTKLFVDETTAPVLDPGRGRTKTGYLWALARDDRPWQGGAPPAVVYSYAPGRRGDYAVALLKGYTGVLQTDGYAGYRALADPKRAGGPATLAFCWAHWRRQFNAASCAADSRMTPSLIAGHLNLAPSSRFQIGTRPVRHRPGSSLGRRASSGTRRRSR
jgi:hypothetical protein